MRYHIGEGRTIIRFSGTISPGILTSTSGNMFNKESTTNINAQKQSNFTLDAKLGVGLYYLITPKVAFVAEPGLVYQSVYGEAWKNYNRVSIGLGLGLVFKP